MNSSEGFPPTWALNENGKGSPPVFRAMRFMSSWYLYRKGVKVTRDVRLKNLRRIQFLKQALAEGLKRTEPRVLLPNDLADWNYRSCLPAGYRIKVPADGKTRFPCRYTRLCPWCWVRATARPLFELVPAAVPEGGSVVVRTWGATLPRVADLRQAAEVLSRSEADLLTNTGAVARMTAALAFPGGPKGGFRIGIRSLSVFPGPFPGVLGRHPSNLWAFVWKPPVSPLNLYKMATTGFRFPRAILLADPEKTRACLEAVKGLHVLSWGGLFKVPRPRAPLAGTEEPS